MAPLRELRDPGRIRGLLFAERFKVAPGLLQREYAFAGDSPNDAPMFSFFDCSVGVANVARFADRLEAEPKHVTRDAAGAGFAELAAYLLDARAGGR